MQSLTQEPRPLRKSRCIWRKTAPANCDEMHDTKTNHCGSREVHSEADLPSAHQPGCVFGRKRVLRCQVTCSPSLLCSCQAATVLLSERNNGLLCFSPFPSFSVLTEVYILKFYPKISKLKWQLKIEIYLFVYK